MCKQVLRTEQPDPNPTWLNVTIHEDDLYKNRGNGDLVLTRNGLGKIDEAFDKGYSGVCFDVLIPFFGRYLTATYYIGVFTDERMVSFTCPKTGVTFDTN